MIKFTLNPMNTKQIAYAYPSSPDATHFGFAKTGCYTVGIAEDSNPAKSLKAFASWQEAADYANTLPEDFNRWSMPQPARSCADAGRAGGLSRASKLTEAQRKAIATKGGKARAKNANARKLGKL